MIPRYQRVLLWALLVVSAVMAIVLIRLRERAQDRLQSAADAAPLTAPDAAPLHDVTLMLANDTDGSLQNAQRRMALPSEPHTRARFLLNQLLAEYAKPGAEHPIAASAGVDDVFLMPLPQGTESGGLLAVVNLSSGLTQVHPSGIEPETMTLLSLIGTLHANMPEITQVRFLVDGAAQDTLAGHADLTRTYLAASAQSAVPQPAASGSAITEPAP
jgi:Sporulation and spore germination